MPKITGTGTPSVGVPVPPQEFDQGRFFTKGEKVPEEETVDSAPKTPAKPDAKDGARKPARTTRVLGK